MDGSRPHCGASIRGVLLNQFVRGAAVGEVKNLIRRGVPDATVIAESGGYKSQIPSEECDVADTEHEVRVIACSSHTVESVAYVCPTVSVSRSVAEKSGVTSACPDCSGRDAEVNYARTDTVDIENRIGECP